MDHTDATSDRAGLRIQVCGGHGGYLGECTLKPGHEGEHEPLGCEASNERLMDAFAEVGRKCAEQTEQEIMRRVISDVDEALPPSTWQRIAWAIGDYPAFSMALAATAGCAATIAVLWAVL